MHRQRRGAAMTTSAPPRVHPGAGVAPRPRHGRLLRPLVPLRRPATLAGAGLRQRPREHSGGRRLPDRRAGYGFEVTSSASMPAVVAQILAALDAEPGMWVLEIQ